MTTDPTSRFPSASLVLDYLDKGIGGELTVPGDPIARIVVDGPKGRLGLRVPADGPLPALPALENVSFIDLLEDGEPWFELSVGVQGNATDVYAVLCGVLDRVQLEHQVFRDAVLGVLASLRHLLLLGERLTPDQQVGLVGELLTLISAITWTGETAAVAAWRGQAREEHDFGFAQIDVEVKTTTSEHRRHLINGVGQLMKTGARPLYILSLQLTGAGAQPGWTLASAVARARASAADSLTGIDAALEAAGYRDEDAGFYQRAWVLRSIPQFYLVDDEFPALTRARLAEAVPNSEHIEDVHYRVNLEGIAPAPSPFAVLAGVEG